PTAMLEVVTAAPNIPVRGHFAAMEYVMDSRRRIAASPPAGFAMPHQRLRKFNTRNIYKNISIDNDMCMVVKAGRHIFIRGQTGFDLDGGFTGVGDAAAQADQAMRNFKVLLAEA